MAAFDDLSLLRVFIGIVEAGSISAGARRMKIPQPTVSRYLRTLEEQCGTALLRRDTHRMSLTETGHRLLADARAMLALAEEAEHRLRQEKTALSGHLRLFATIDSGQFTVTRLIAGFLQVNPQVTAELSFKPVFISEGVTSLREAARAGLGVCVLPEWLIGEDLLSGKLLRILPPWTAPPYQVHVVYPAQRMLPARVRAFVDFAVSYMSRERQEAE